jgi:hypothetical protein
MWQINAANLEKIPEAELGRSHVNTSDFPASQFTATHRFAAVKGCAPLNYGLSDGSSILGRSTELFPV